MKLTLGRTFADYVTSYKPKHTFNPQKTYRGWGVRITAVYILLIVFFFVLSVRLFHLTIVNGAENRDLSEGNRVRTITIHAPRGMFVDRMGKKLTNNIPAFRVTGPCEENAPCPAQLLSEEAWRKSGIDAKSVYLEQDVIRAFTYPYETAHVLGFLGEITQEEISNPLYTYQDYLLGDRLGRSGLEEAFEKKLRGTDGKELIEIDANHNKIRTLGKVDPIPGQTITLALDMDLQAAAYQAMGEFAGAVIVSKPKTGEILSLVSTPSYNPNKLQTGLSEDEYTKIFQSADKPMFNRALAGVYPPGSTFKIVAALAALESGSMTASETIEDTGILRIGDFSFANWYFTQYGRTEGAVNMEKAIARSNDIYFYNLGERTGIDVISEWGKKVGIGAKTGIELIGEAEGVMPDRDYQRAVRGTDWYLGDSYHIAIGQGDLLVTPLQVNRWTTLVANGGRLCPFTLLKVDKNTGVMCADLQINEAHLQTIARGMQKACDRGSEGGYQGTGYPFFDFEVRRETISDSEGKSEVRRVPVACKTGTAETGDPDRTHAWFTAFAPLPAGVSTKEGVTETVVSGEPEIAVTVLVENGGEGSSVAAPIAKKIFEEWFGR
ncbi:hypothetical protein C4564_01590 [Candidatus Microgenomates bacterium]|nr:MAG: hypothetical protein C4564_01590 [Candidatus Microgenomates bacterium]